METTREVREYIMNAVKYRFAEIEDLDLLVQLRLVFIEVDINHKDYTRIIDSANDKGYSIIMLNASEMGKTLYKKLGFSEIHNGMILKCNRKEPT